MKKIDVFIADFINLFVRRTQTDDDELVKQVIKKCMADAGINHIASNNSISKRRTDVSTQTEPIMEPIAQQNNNLGTNKDEPKNATNISNQAKQTQLESRKTVTVRAASGYECFIRECYAKDPKMQMQEIGKKWSQLSRSEKNEYHNSVCT